MARYLNTMTFITQRTLSCVLIQVNLNTIWCKSIFSLNGIRVIRGHSESGRLSGLPVVFWKYQLLEEMWDIFVSISRWNFHWKYPCSVKLPFITRLHHLRVINFDHSDGTRYSEAGDFTSRLGVLGTYGARPFCVKAIEAFYSHYITYYTTILSVWGI